MIKEGSQIPLFSLKNQKDSLFQLSEYVGKKAFVLFFYPKNFTPGCIKEVCSFRDHYELFSDNGIEVIGISSDSDNSHKKFIKKYQLPFTLLSDKNGHARKLFGLKNSFFRLLPGRVTFVVNIEGTIILSFSDQFKSELHIENALSILNIKKKSNS